MSEDKKEKNKHKASTGGSSKETYQSPSNQGQKA